MSLLEVSDLGRGITEVKLNRPKANALNHELVTELKVCFENLRQEEQNQGAILTGQFPFFSAGLDVVELFSYNQEQMMAFWNDFQEMIVSLLSYDKPLVAAISGHSPAGGCILALCADYRLMTEGKNRIGLNEAAVSIVIPKAIRSLYASVIGHGEANKALLRGTLFEAKQAYDLRLVDELSSPEDLPGKALDAVLKFTGMPSLAWRASKRILKAELIEELNDPEKSGFADAAKYWWAEDCRNFLEQMILALKKPKQ